jgi:hypothetical protein
MRSRSQRKIDEILSAPFLSVRGLDDFNLVGGYPDVDLAEAVLPGCLHGPKEVARRRVVGVNPQAEELVTVARAAVLPGAGDADCVLRDSPNLSLSSSAVRSNFSGSIVAPSL